ncbi:MAG: Integral membrane protein MviN, partial [Candidatus Azambacteria bacterium GW2011_GWA1_44_9]
IYVEIASRKVKLIPQLKLLDGLIIGTAQAIALLLVRSFYALKDTRTPVIVSILSVSLNVTLSFYFVQNLHLEVWGLGASYAISSNFAFLLLLYFLHHKVGGFNLNDLFMPTLKMLLAAVVAAVALYIPIKALDQLVFDTTHTINLILLTGIASIFGLGVYLLLVWLLKVRELETFGQLIRRIYKFKFELKSEEIVQHPDTV